MIIAFGVVAAVLLVVALMVGIPLLWHAAVGAALAYVEYLVAKYIVHREEIECRTWATVIGLVYMVLWMLGFA